MIAAGISALSLGQPFPKGTAKMYAPTGEYWGHIETHGKGAYFYDNFGRLNISAEQIGDAMYFSDGFGRSLGHSRRVASNRTDLYSAEGQLMGYQIIDGARIAWIFYPDGALAGYALIGRVNLAALGVGPNATVYGLTPGLLAAVAGGAASGDDSRQSSTTTSAPAGNLSPSMATVSPPLPPLSSRVVKAADRVYTAGHRCRTEGDVASCRKVTAAYINLSDAIREESFRLSRPEENKEN